jgi:hypothetical protein
MLSNNNLIKLCTTNLTSQPLKIKAKQNKKIDIGDERHEN